MIRESGFKKADDFYVALGSGKLQPGSIVNKVIQRLKTEQVVDEAPVIRKAPKSRRCRGTRSGVAVQGVEDVLVRLAKCCTPVPGDEIIGYISLGKGITIHRDGLPECAARCAGTRSGSRRSAWDGETARRASASRSRSTPGIAPGCSRTSRGRSPSTVRTSSATSALVEDQLAKNWYTVEVGDVKSLRTLLNSLRNLDAVFDAYRVTPS